MEIIAATCPQCNAGLKIKPGVHTVNCIYCDTSIIIKENSPTCPIQSVSHESPTATESMQSVVFARWNSRLNFGGHYYPAYVTEIGGGQMNASFLDGDSGVVLSEDVLELDEALNTLELEGNWKHLGLFYKGRLSNRNPLVMNYNDGDVEQIELAQLRGRLPKALRKRK